MFHVPLKVVASALHQALTAYDESSNSSSNLKEIHVVDIIEENINQVSEYFQYTMLDDKSANQSITQDGQGLNTKAVSAEVTKKVDATKHRKAGEISKALKVKRTDYKYKVDPGTQINPEATADRNAGENREAAVAKRKITEEANTPVLAHSSENKDKIKTEEISSDRPTSSKKKRKDKKL